MTNLSENGIKLGHAVVAYMPGKQREFDTTDYSETILPDGIETVPKRFAIDYRNRWMIRQSDCVVTYVTNDIGSGAAKYKKLAVINKITVYSIF